MPDSLLPTAVPDPGRLAEALVSRSGRPVDAWAVVASLESEGWRDVDVRPLYDDLFELGEAVYGAVGAPPRLPLHAGDGHAAGLPALADPATDDPAPDDPAPDDPESDTADTVTATARPADPYAASWANGLRSYGVGLMYSLPVVGQVAALVLLGYSLWASVTLTASTATIIGIGTVGSFVLTGGLVQAMARETSRLLGAGLRSQARRVGFRFSLASSAVVVVIGATVWAVNWVLPFYPARLAGTGVLYFVGLGLLWVTLGMLYVQERILAVSVATTAGVLPVVLAVEGLGWAVVPAQALGLATAIAVAWAWAWRTLGREADDRSGVLPPLPRLSTIVHTTLPFGAYGTLYFVFLFTDRIVAWTAPAADPLPFIVWFRTTYELGMDWSLAVLFPLLALHPYAVRRLTTGLREAMDGPVEGTSARFLREYARHVVVLLVLGAVFAVAVWWGGAWIGREGPPLLRTVVETRASQMVYLVAAPSYVLYAWGLLNALVFLSEGHPLIAIRPLVVAVAANLIVGVVVSRVFTAEFAVVGLLAGALVFAALTTRRMLALARHADHLTYAAY